MKKMRTFLMKDDESVIEQVDDLARSRGTSRNALYREAVRMFLEKQKEAKAK